MQQAQAQSQTKKNWYFYKTTGIVKFTYFVDDTMAPSEEKALEYAKDTIIDDIDYSNQKGHTTIEILELKVEPLRPATKKEIVDGYGADEWED